MKRQNIPGNMSETGDRRGAGWNRQIGCLGEELAAGMLRNQGYEILERGFRCTYGEIDIIARRRGVLVFAEVKTRTSLAFGRPSEAVTAEKRRHMKSAAAAYLQQQKGRICHSCSFQVIEILINQIEDAF
ncbi:MAG: YraN family protein [Emergencia sp.]